MGIDEDGNGQSDDRRFAELVRFKSFKVVGPDVGGKEALIREIAEGSLREIVNTWAPLKLVPKETLLTWAVRSDDVELVKVLLEAGADPNRGVVKPTKSDPNEPPITIVESVEVARLLLDAGADPNAVDGVGDPALACASSGRLPDVALLLVERGADVLARNAMGEALLSAARRDAPEVYRALRGVAIERLRAAPGRSLIVSPRRRPTTDFVTSFVKPRVSRGAQWEVVATKLDADRLAALVAEMHAGSRLERDAKDRRVLGDYGIFVFAQRTVPFSVALLATAVGRLARDRVGPSLAARCSRESSAPSYLLHPICVDEYVRGELAHRADVAADPDQLAHASRRAMALVEDRCAELGIHLPPCLDVGDGLECILEVHEGTADDYEPFHVVVLDTEGA